MDMYSNRFVLSVLVNNSPQNELANGTVKVPFGTEYALRLRNKNARRAVVKIFIDGEEVSGSGYLVPAQSHIDIKRHGVKDAAFKFVDLDSPEAVDFGKNGPNTDKQKGVIEARFFLEKEAPAPQVIENHHHHHHYMRPPTYIRPYTIGGSQCYDDSDVMRMTFRRGLACTPQTTYNSVGLNSLAGESPMLRDGCTVEGSTTGQRFSSVELNYDESNYTTLKVFLQGFDPLSIIEPRAIIGERKATVLERPLTPLESEALAAEEEEVRLRTLLAKTRAKKLREELLALDVTA